MGYVSGFWVGHVLGYRVGSGLGFRVGDVLGFWVSWWGLIKVTSRAKVRIKNFSTHHTNMNQCAFESPKPGGSDAF